MYVCTLYFVLCVLSIQHTNKTKRRKDEKTKLMQERGKDEKGP